MTTRRLTRIADVVRYWSFFRDGILYEAKYLRYSYSFETYRRILFHLVAKNPKAWVGVAFSDDTLATPVAFILSHDVTPLFSDEREFEVSMFYFLPGQKPALRTLQTAFDVFCRENSIKRYYLTTSSFSSSADRVFQDSWKGLERSNTVFKRVLS